MFTYKFALSSPPASSPTTRRDLAHPPYKSRNDLAHRCTSCAAALSSAVSSPRASRAALEFISRIPSTYMIYKSMLRWTAARRSFSCSRTPRRLCA